MVGEGGLYWTAEVVPVKYHFGSGKPYSISAIKSVKGQGIYFS